MALLDLTLLSGERIWAASLHCEETYAHVYEGLPDHESNDGYLAHFRERVERIFHGPYPVHVVEPIRHVPEPNPYSAFGMVPEYLPKYWFAAECYDNGMNCLALVWFQAEPFPIPSEQARAALEAIDWAKHAEEFTP
jgi:hypothetical protein